ncbi:MAG: methyltransferase domain-containing protein, partial [Phycisphaerales bacterium JB038]
MNDCCGNPISEQEQVRDTVRQGYARIAEAGDLSAGAGCSCCGGGETSAAQQRLAERLGYDADELAALPQGANMGLSCGNPTAIAELQPGQVVLDLGSGGGFDCFLAGPRVGETGRVIGVDMTPEMLRKARDGRTSYRQATGLDNVEFRL